MEKTKDVEWEDGNKIYNNTPGTGTGDYYTNAIIYLIKAIL